MDGTPVALVINMPSARKRRAMQVNQLTSLGLDYRFLDATTVEAIPGGELARFERGWCRPLAATEVACALSHRRAWAEVAAGSAPVLILEDDAVLGKQTRKVLQALRRQPGLDCVNLETYTTHKVLGTPRPIDGCNHTLSRVFRDSGGAAAYLLWPEGARKLLASLPGFFPLADAAINLATGLRKYQLEPACAIQAMFTPELMASDAYRTSISTAHRPAIGTIHHRLRYKLRRLFVSAILFRKQLRGIGRSGKRIVQFTP